MKTNKFKEIHENLRHVRRHDLLRRRHATRSSLELRLHSLQRLRSLTKGVLAAYYRPPTGVVGLTYVLK